MFGRGGTTVSTHPLVGEVRLGEEFQYSCFRDNSNRETNQQGNKETNQQGWYPMLRYRGREGATQRNSLEGSRQRESEIVQDALQGEHNEEVLRKAKEEKNQQHRAKAADRECIP